jgi:hypothetical protein
MDFASMPSVVLMLAALIAVGCSRAPSLSVCELAKDYPRFRDKVVAARGVYYYGLRQRCPEKCIVGEWPSFVDLIHGTDDTTWTAIDKAERDVEARAKQSGQRFEIWVTVVGRLGASATRSPLGPCDRAQWGKYGHLGAFPAQLVVIAFRDIEVKVNPDSPYDYAGLYRGPT